MTNDSQTPIVSKRNSPKGVFSLYADNYTFDSTWREQAACKDKPISIFFPNASESRSVVTCAEALNICQNCPVAHFCLFEAMKYNYDGVWGNTIYKQRLYYIRTELNNDVTDLSMQQVRRCLQLSRVENVYILSRSNGRKRKRPVEESQ